MRGRPRHEPGRWHRPQGAPHLFRLPDCLRGRLGLSPPDRPAVVPGHRDREQPQHADAARAGEPAGAEPQRTRLPPRVLQHGRDPAPSRADPDHAPARRGEKAQDDGPGLFRRRHRLHPLPDAPGDRIAAVAVMTELFREFSTRRATRLGLNSVLIVVLMGTILGILTFLAARHSVRWDFSETKRFTLAPQTARLLRELPREVKVTVFTSDQSPVRLEYRDLIDSYRAHSAKLTAEFVDPERRPGVARQYGITRPDTAVLESGKQETRIASASEQELTNALIRVTKDEKKTVYFLTGHAEHLLEDGSKEGYSFLKEALERQGYTVRSLSLYESKTIPTKASVLVLAGPQKPVAPAEQLRLADYVRTGGRLLILLDPGSRAGLEGTLAAWGLRTDNRTVLDTQTILGGDLTMPVVNTYGTHEITQDLGQVFTMFSLAPPVSFLDSKGNEWVFP